MPRALMLIWASRAELLRDAPSGACVPSFARVEMNALRLPCPCTMHPRLCLLALAESITAFLFDTGSERRDHHEGGHQPSWSSSGWWWAKACLPRQRWGSRCRRPSTGSSSQHACWPMRRVPPPRWWHCPRRSYRLNAPDRGRPRSFAQTDELHRIPHLDPSTRNTACDDHSTSLETKDILDWQEKPSLLFSDLRYHDPINGPRERYNARVVRSFNIHYGGWDCFVDVPRDDWHLCPVKAKRLQERPYVRCG